MLTTGAYNVLKVLMIIYLFLMVWIVLRYNRSLRKERRISSYTLKTNPSKPLSFGDGLASLIKRLVIMISKVLNKNIVVKKLARRKDKYLYLFKNEKIKNVDFISYKILLFLGLWVLVFTYNLMINHLMTFGEVLAVMMIAYLSVEAYLYYLYTSHNRRLKDQVLDAIILMNNAFQAGNSTLLALENVYQELDNEMGLEFKQVYTDVTKGLGIDEAFTRLAKRTSIKEIDYIAASITIMNKSGGNIIRVFERILAGYYARKKVEAETNAILIVSKITMAVLIFMPLIFALFITLANPTYFAPLFNTGLGNALMIVIGVLYIVYIYLTTRLIKGVKVW